MPRLAGLKELDDYRAHLAGMPEPKRRLWVCGGTGCLAGGAVELFKALKTAADEKGLADIVELKVDLFGCR